MHMCKASLILSLIASSAQGYETFKSKCAALSTNGISGSEKTNINFAQFLPAQSVIDLAAEGVNQTCLGSDDAPPLPTNICRVSLSVSTSDTSGVIIEAWLPENWSGRFLSVGNGGFGGCILYADLAYGVSYGFATVGTNNGHNGTSGGAFYNQPEVLEDFVWRALYTGVVVGKKVTKQFYGKEHTKSYYLGCSLGGLQGWGAVQSYPELFDGVVAGAPAIGFDAMFSWIAFLYKTLGFDNSNEAFLSPGHWALVHKTVMSQCDSLDGLEDGILEDSRQCHPDLSALLCPAGATASSDCLTAPQVHALKKVYSPYTVNGTFINSGTNHGAAPGFSDAIYRPVVQTWVLDFFRYIVFSDPSWDLTQYKDEDAITGMRASPPGLHSKNGNLSAFRNRGGKVLHWHGQLDQVVVIENSDRYYDHVSQTMNASPAELDEFYRYFRISGTLHCRAGGPGAHVIGQTWGLNSTDEPEDNILLRMVEWVEHGKGPDFVRGTKFVDNDRKKGVAFTRDHCKHPAVNMHKDGKWQCITDAHL
ncbi:putative feruloyl esterase [Amniculicola lignicola CBS 123094]|uniref:Carboxylic ester hydrolase n=1 Tax=Amniculicola lignicola CBS 123094 TaxID=1392246 RepID=A0A6A5WPA6_9PLEO|nr:putative feruloyl esterase [Amniculicola lignicola CBS 123094]